MPTVPRPSARRELALGLAVFGLYSLIAGLDWAGRERTALAHARAVVSFERSWHLDIEPALNSWLAPRPVLRVLANYEYATTYVLSAFLLLLWLYLRRPDVYCWARSSFVLLNLLGVACFALYPLAPPRLLPPEYGFVDTVRLGHTWGSWGSPLVGHANQLAAMPSLHIGWALWVSVVLARIHGGRRTQLLSGAHVLLTAWVILATGNHYLLDAVGAALLVWLCVALTGRQPPPGPPVPGADAFFLHVETPAAPQQVGGAVLVDVSSRPGGAPSREQVQARVQGQLGRLPRFRQRLVERGRWRRPRWVELAPAELDWEWHVPLVDLARPDGSPGGLTAFRDLVATLAGTTLPRDRPLWRFVVVHGIEPGVAAAVILVHHVVADGIGAIAQAVEILEPAVPPAVSAARPPGPARTVLATVVGLAQLATDGRPDVVLPSSGRAARSFGATTVPLDEVREIAHRHGSRVSDVMLTVVAGGLRTALLRAGVAPPERLRASVPLTMRDLSAAAEGNVTAAVMLDLPLGALTPAQRLAEVASLSARLRTPTRAIASRFVMRAAGEVLPPPLHAWFARTVYGPRFFSAIVSNMPGPPLQLSLLGAPLIAAFPLLPLAPAVPLAVGAMGLHGTMCVGIVVDPALVPDADTLGRDIRQVLQELGSDAASPAREQTLRS